MEKKRIVIYVALAYGLAWALWFAVVYPMVNGGGLGTSMQLAIAAGMFAPAIAAALTRLITKEGFKDAWIKPRAFKKTWRYYVLAWFGPLVLVLAGAALYFLINPADFDPSMSYVIQAMREQAEAMGVEMNIDDEAIRLTQIASLATLVIAPAINAVTCFGEEWGWRGYLLPHLLERFSIIPTLLISGIIWGIWHAPITLISVHGDRRHVPVLHRARRVHELRHPAHRQLPACGVRPRHGQRQRRCRHYLLRDGWQSLRGTGAHGNPGRRVLHRGCHLHGRRPRAQRLGASRSPQDRHV